MRRVRKSAAAAVIGFVAVASMLVQASPVTAQAPQIPVRYPLTELTPPSGHPAQTQFGAGLAISGTTLAVGAPGRTPGTGRVYIYQEQVSGQWSTAAVLTDPQPRLADSFGYTVGLSPSGLVVSAPANGTTSNSRVYFYARASGGWKLVDQVALQSLDVAVSGPTVVLGQASERGAVQVYQRGPAGDWTRTATLFDPSGQRYDGFPGQMAISGGTIAAAALGGPAMQGHVYTYGKTSSGWSYQASIGDPTPHISDDFGIFLGLDDGTLATCDFPSYSIFVTAQCYVYQLAGGRWILTSTLSAPHQLLGGGIAVSGGTVVAASTSPVFVYAQGSRWQPVGEFEGKGATAGTTFGEPIAISGGIVAAGAFNSNGQTGHVYIFSLHQLSSDTKSSTGEPAKTGYGP